ncbi:MAG: glucose-1-phosphate cytidylyltransferase [SAR324 cluster bacterium]|nr:glucose-1-phosphate cytidylyltransferase [SAR324 cluster bacterium]MBF0351737.1 glucose-1-phosphate cytidylyltransferase [SAR324 cluster bacterium]
MKVVILAGGFGTRLSEYTDIKPKPMVEIGGHPILWHIMNIYAHYGFKDFIVALGYKGQTIKEFFLNYYALNSSFTIELGKGQIQYHDVHPCDWRVTLVDTGMDSMTGGRLKRLKEYLGNETFMLTYGDGVADVDLKQLLAFHQSHGKIATMTAVHPKARYGELEIQDGIVREFKEKPQFKQSWINGGFMVMEPAFLELIDGDNTILEKEPMERLTLEEELMAFHHKGFWQCMDTLRDMKYLNELWDSGTAPWHIWT